jgi:tetratricopeptide (TPR) repeat protein
MDSAISRRLLPLVAVAVAALLLGAAPASAQTGMLKGKVVDAKGQPIEGAKVTIAYADGVTRQFETKTNRKGDFIQIGLQPGNYKVTAEKEGMSQAFDVRVRLGAAAEVNFQLVPGMVAGAGGGGMSKEDAEKLAQLRAVVDAGAAANQAGNYDEAIAKFTEAIALRPSCHSCYYAIGVAHARKKEFEQAEAALKKAVELKADYAEAYDELATVYNNQKKFDLAAEASAQATKLAGGDAAGGGSPDMMYNQGVILWNAGKIADAKKIFEQVVAAKPDHADAHYQLGMANLNEGKLPEAATAFEAYLKLAPDGQYAAQAKAVLAQIKK